MDPLRLMMRAKRLAQNPPSMRQALFYAAILGLCLGVAGYEWLFGWPDWLSVNSLRK